MTKCPKCKSETKKGYLRPVGVGYSKICWAKEKKFMYPLWKGLTSFKDPIHAQKCDKCKIIFFNYEVSL